MPKKRKQPAGLKAYWAEKKKSSTKKGGARKYVREAYEKSKQRVKRISVKPRKKANKPRKKTDSGLKLPKLPKVLTKVAIGLGAATLAGMTVGIIAPQYIGIAKPIAALVAGGIPGVAAELIVDQGILGNVMGIFGGASINEQRLGGGL